LNPAETTFSALTPKNPQDYIVLFGMPSSWSYIGVSKGNKENVVAGMANLSITDDEGSRNLSGGSNKPNVPSKPQGIGRRTDSSPLPLAAAPHDNTIESLRQELMGMIQGQANDIRTLKSKVNGLTSSNAEFTSSNAKLTSSNAELLEKVQKLAESTKDMSSTLQSHTRTLHALNRRMFLDDARNKLANDYSFTLDEVRPRSSDVGPCVQHIQSKLNTEHAKLLSYEALFMIFDSSDDSMRDSGNKAAHEGPLADRIDSVLDGTLTETHFAYGKEPNFERST